MNTTITTLAGIARKVQSRFSLLGILPLILIALAGCDTMSSPTGPAAPIAEAALPNSVAANGPTLHAIMVADTDAGDIGETVRIDLDNMNALVGAIAANTGLGLNKIILSGSSATTAKIQQTITTLGVGPDDVILFYHAGHGGRLASTRTQWPDMYFHHDPEFAGFSLHDVFTQLKRKGSRLVLALSDACNSRLDAPLPASSSQGAALKGSNAGFQKLFVESRGAIIASGSITGELAYGTVKDGGLFTTQFTSVLYQKASDGNSTWTDVMDRATLRIADLQQPQYAMQ